MGEYTDYCASQEEVTQQITVTKIRIAEVQKTKPSAEMYDEIIVTLSQELTDLEKKVKEVNLSKLDLLILLATCGLVCVDRGAYVSVRPGHL